VFELLNRLDIPYRVVINEALDLSKEFGANDAFKFVNGVLDQIAIEKRALER
jgi:N utilization substance protein B